VKVWESDRPGIMGSARNGRFSRRSCRGMTVSFTEALWRKARAITNRSPCSRPRAADLFHDGASHVWSSGAVCPDCPRFTRLHWALDGPASRREMALVAKYKKAFETS